MENIEIWKQIEDFDYQISNKGTVKSVSRIAKNRFSSFYTKEKILKPLKLNKGYLGVRLYKNSKGVTKKIHRLVAEAFIPNPNNLPQVNHKDENPSNNFVYVNTDGTVDIEKSNLEWCTAKYNNNYGTRNEKVSKNHAKLNKKITLQYTLDKQLVAEYESAAEASRQTGFDVVNIRLVCEEKKKSYKNFIWKYKKVA